eukprot:gene10650-14302_t
MVLLVLSLVERTVNLLQINGNLQNFKQLNFQQLRRHSTTSDVILAESRPNGTITLIGSGPGDPDLLTIQAYKLIKSASLVIADRLISKEILDLIECELKVANKKPGCAEEAQDEINRWVLEGLSSGKKVVRLKIGDPFLFGRGGEEILEYRKYGYEPMIVPGISSSYSAPLAANIPITHRGIANQVLICTGYGQNGSIIDIPEYHSDRTLVLLMAVGRISEIASNMTLYKNYPQLLPVCIIEKATTPQQRLIYGTLNDIGEIALTQQAKAPATIVIGDVVHALNSNNITLNKTEN